jgi:lipoprotein-anchoring transpeptidase ErfK/SrfK
MPENAAAVTQKCRKSVAPWVFLWPFSGWGGGAPHHIRALKRQGLAMRFRLFGGISSAIALASVLAGCPAQQTAKMSRQEIEAQAKMANSASFLGMYQIARIPREIVAAPEKAKPGTIIIKTNERRLYYVMEDGKALRYGIGVGRDGFRWSGVETVSMKREWPDWTPPEQMLKRRPDLPRHMLGGPDKPLGARAMYLGSSFYLIQGSNE